MKQRTYNVGPSTLTLVFGDIINSTADVLVSSDDWYITMRGGVSAAIRGAGGDTILFDVAKHTPASLGDVVVTSAGFLKAKYVFHAITIGAEEGDPGEIVKKTTRRCLELLGALRLRSIAFPAIGAGVAGFNYDRVAVEMAETITPMLAASPRKIDVSIYLYDRYRRLQPIDYLSFFEEFSVRTRPHAIQATVSPSLELSVSPVRDERGERRKELLEELAELDQERGILEGRLAHRTVAPSADELREIAAQLNTIHEGRVRLLAAVGPSQKRDSVPIFVSYCEVDEDLRRELGKHLSVLERQGIISTWQNRLILPGMDRSEAVDKHIEAARVILLLISADFVSSPYSYDVEIERALKRHQRGDAVVIPVILRPVVLHGLPFAGLRSLPSNGKAVTEWSTVDAAFVDITEGIKDAIQQFATIGA